jgi:DHA1 family multidrug resistance protein-like MFS transporter
MAYVSDSTTEEERSRGIGWLGAAMGLVVILGPGLGGWLAKGSLSLPFFLASGLSALSAVLTYFMLPESKPAVDDKTQPESRSVFQFQAMWQALKSPIGILFFISFLVSFGLTNFEAIFGLYALEKFNYGPEQVGTILMVIAVVSTIGKAVLTGPATQWWGEARIIKGSLLVSSLGFVALLLANTYATILLATGFFILSKTLLRPAVLSLTSKQTNAGQGTAMGLNNAFMSLGRIIGPVWAGFIFDVNIEWPYISGVIIMFTGFIISLITVRFPYPNKKENLPTQPVNVSQ